uniref:Ulp1 protease family, C-terminal catalytic domain-containing protein n=1 Tax=Tanacetum cinerariifolium TaxID=118510 RepID=A0A6L2LER4_TANCI|nr:hypothetical protein [Tanacetum cinerariifolium]
MQPLRQSQKLSKSHKDNNFEVYVSNNGSPSTGGQSEQKKNKKRISSSSSALKRSGRFGGQRPVVEEKTIDEAINVHEEDSDDDFVAVSNPTKQVTRSNATPVKWTKRMIIARSLDSADEIKESEITKGKKRASTDNKMIRNKKKKGETANVATKDTCADTEVGPSKIRKETKTRKNEKQVSTTLRTRSSPKAMYLAFATLNSSQQACVAKMGFEGLLDFKVDSIPSRLGFYVVDKFDPVSMEIKLKNDSLVVNKEVISEMLGLRNEGINILMNEVLGNEEMIQDWKDQFNVPEKDITPSIIKSKIRRSTVVDFNFKLNIIMLFANIMGCCKKTGSCEFEILKHISRDTNLYNINWCQYVLDSLPLCKDGWKKDLLNNFFCGPVTLLTMIYVDGVQCKSLPMARRRPPTSAWSAEVLKERETEEIASGGFGLGEKEGPFVKEDENEFSDDLEGFGWKLVNYIETIHKSKTCFEKTLAIGLEMFPNHDMLIDLQEKYVQVMNLQTGGGNGHNNFQTGNSSASMGKSGEIDKVQERKSDRVELIGFNSLEYAFGPVTQAEVLETAEQVTSAKLKGRAVDIDDIPSFSLGVTQDFEEYNSGDITVVSKKVIQPIQATPVSFCPPAFEKNVAVTRKEKRSTHVTSNMKSPFMSRGVNIDGVLSAVKNRVSKNLFQMRGNAFEILFETTNGHRSNRAMMESLAPSTAVEDNILDAWAEYLNFNEHLRDASLPLRAFLPTFVVTEEFKNAKLSAEVRYNLFKDYMQKAIVKDQRWMNFKDVELVFIPVSNEGYQFVEVFDLKTGDVCIMEYKKEDKAETKNLTKPNKKGGGIENDIVSTILHADFGRYLTTVGHTKASAIFAARLNFIRMKCQSKSKSADWGVYAMRHMETYMGNMKEKCECGLDVDGRKHTSQINKLREKYAAKILLSGCNIHYKKVGDLLNEK